MEIRDEDNAGCFTGASAKVFVQNSVHLRVSKMAVAFSRVPARFASLVFSVTIVREFIRAAIKISKTVPVSF